jgi:hypothetical protein
MSEKEQPNREVKEGKETVLDVKQIVDFLNHAFRQATQGMGKATRSKDGTKTALYDLQVEFSYMIREITSGPTYIVPKIVTECNELIAKAGELKAHAAAEAQA